MTQNTHLKPLDSVDDYIAGQPASIREKLRLLRVIIKEAAPQAEEVISYQMPGYRDHGMIAYFGAAKNHYALYRNPVIMDRFRPKLKAYSLTKSAIHFPYDHEVPPLLIKEIIYTSVQNNLERLRLKKTTKSQKK